MLPLPGPCPPSACSPGATDDYSQRQPVPALLRDVHDTVPHPSFHPRSPPLLHRTGAGVSYMSGDTVALTPACECNRLLSGVRTVWCRFAHARRHWRVPVRQGAAGTDGGQRPCALPVRQWSTPQPFPHAAIPPPAARGLYDVAPHMRHPPCSSDATRSQTSGACFVWRLLKRDVRVGCRASKRQQRSAAGECGTGGALGQWRIRHDDAELAAKKP